MNILGISCYYHDAAAVLIRGGEIVAAAEEERFSRIKHDSSFPKKAINFCLQFGQIKSSDLDYVVFYEKPFRKFHRMLVSSLSAYPRSYAMFREAMRIWLTQKLWIKQEIASYLNINSEKILFSEHHLSHAASCFYPSPFIKAAILTVDGVGEWTTASYGIGNGNQIKIIKEIRYPQSLGLLYSAFTAFLGFEVNEGEWKVMGLAPYGKPRYTDKVWKTVKQYKDGSFSLDFSYFSFQYSDKYTYSSKFIDLFGEPIPPKQSSLTTERSANLAASIQKVTEELLLSMVKNLRSITKLDYLCFSGGVALNCVANYRLLREGEFKNIYIQPAAGDSGGAMGAALYVYHNVLGDRKRSILNHAYLGQEYSNQEIESFLCAVCRPEPVSGSMSSPRKRKSIIKEKKFRLGGQNDIIKYKKLADNKLVEYVSHQITRGKVIGWMQGRLEWGPRVLGNRSILADPRNPKMKDIINSKVKFREAFRPFAPSVLAEYARQVFNLSFFKPTTYNPQLTTHYPLRFMLYVVPVRKDWQKRVPAINHADNTARPQLVYKNENPLYHSLISAFYRKTKVPLILNTSFNLRGEPIVTSPADAYSTFIRSGIDILVMGNFVCEKK